MTQSFVETFIPVYIYIYIYIDIDIDIDIDTDIYSCHVTSLTRD